MTEAQFSTIITRFDNVDRVLRSLDERVETLESKIDRLSGVRFDADRLLTGFNHLKARVAELEARS